MNSKNIVYLAKSLDGFIAGKNGELDWLNAIPNPDNVEMGFVNLMEEVDAVVMGRTTFDTVCSFEGEWPYNKHVFVLSHSLSKIPEQYSGQATLLNGSVQEILSSIHKKGFQILYIDGGRTVQNFLKEDLIDELRITTIPIILGDGIPLFTILPQSIELEHICTEVFLGQLVQSHYRRKK